MKPGILAFLILTGLDVSLSHAATTIKKIDFKGGSTPILEISGDGPIQIQKTENSQDQQIVLEMKDAVLSKSVRRKLDTSSFQGPVSLISPYQISGDPIVTRVVIQLRDVASAELSEGQNRVSVRFIAGGAPQMANGTAPADLNPTTPPASEAATAKLDPIPGEAPIATSTAAAPATSTTSGAPVSDAAATTQAAGTPDKDSPESKMDQFIETRESRQFIGSPISLQLKDAEIQDILRMIGEASGFNIVIGEGVRGNLTLSLTDVPWDQVLDLVLSTLRLGAERSNNVLRIETLDNMTKQKTQELAARQASEMTAQRITRIFPISYAKIGDLSGILQAFAAPKSTSSNPNDTNTVVIKSDDRTNSLIVQGVPETVEKIRKLIQLLDTQTPQVMIEAKIVEASQTFSKSLSGNIGAATRYHFGSFNGGDPSKALTASAASGTGSSLLGSSPVMGFLPGVTRLNALLSMSENEGETKIITSPRVVVLNRQSANIVQTQPIRIDVTTINNGVQVVTPQQLNANISLAVTPTVTNDGSVLLDLGLTRDVPSTNGQPTIANRNIKTSVIVDSGSTLVVGGIFSNDDVHNESGTPFLRKIPIIGALFGTKSSSNSRSELFFFVTPKILNQSETMMQTTAMAPSGG